MYVNSMNLKWMVLVLSAFMSIGAMAQSDGFRDGKDYIVLDPPLPTRAPEGKIEVIEFFNFSCPHCNRFQTPMNIWHENADISDVELIRQPVYFEAHNGHYARLYHTLEAMGLVDRYYSRIYEAIHKKRILLNSPGRFAGWLENNGEDGEKASKVYDSFTVNAKIKRDRKTAEEYGVDSTPHVAVAGKYVIKPGLSGTMVQMVQIMEALIARERAAMAGEGQ